MKVLFANRDPSLMDGGDTNKIYNYMRTLDERGYTTDYAFNVWGGVDFDEWDIIHGFHLGHEFSYKFFLEAKRLGKPYILSPIYFPGQRNHHQYRVEMVLESDAVLYLSEGEKETVSTLFENKTAVENNAHIVPNGVNPLFKPIGEKYRHPFRPDEEYVLCVGRLDDRKNQHVLAQACMELDIPLVLIGDPADKYVVSHCQSIADRWDGLWWEPAKPPEMLADAYRGARVLACPSTLEMWPNVVAEGGMSGCNLVVSDGSMSFHDLDFVFSCSPRIHSIKKALTKAYKLEKDYKGVEYFSQFTWDKTADMLEGIYNSVLET